MARYWLPVVLAAALLAPSSAAANSAYLGVWRLAPQANSPWANGGTLTIRSSSRSEVEQFNNSGSTAGPVCLGYKEEVPEDFEPHPTAWYFLTYDWSGGGTMGGCISNKSSSQLVFFGKNENIRGSIYTGDGKSGGGGWGNDPKFEYVFNATKDSGGGDGGGGGDATGCAGSAGVFASPAAACNLPFGRLSTLPVPDPGEPTDISSGRVPANTKTVEVEAEVTDAEIDKFLATLAIVKRKIAENNALGTCIIFGGGGDIEDEVVYGAVEKACIKLLHAAATSPTRKGRAAAGRCRVAIVPVWRRGSRPSPRQRRKAAAGYRRLVAASCRSSSPRRLKFRVTARGTSAKLNPLLGRRARAGVVRVAPRTAKEGPNAKLRVRWRRR